MIVKNRIAGTRITIWDVLHYLEAGWSRPDIAVTLHLTEAQVAAAAGYIEDHRDVLRIVRCGRYASVRKLSLSPQTVMMKVLHRSNPPSSDRTHIRVCLYAHLPMTSACCAIGRMLKRWPIG